MQMLSEKNSEARKANRTRTKFQKFRKKLLNDVLKELKTSLERISGATRNAFSCHDTFSRGTIRRTLKNMEFFWEMLHNVSLKKKANVFIQNGVSIR